MSAAATLRSCMQVLHIPVSCRRAGFRRLFRVARPQSQLCWPPHPPCRFAMSLFAVVAGLCVALLHVYIMVLEMVLWTRPLGLKTFRNTFEKAEATRVLAANQGLYNGFLAAGLFWGALQARADVLGFFLGCVVVAGCYGAYSVNRRIFVVQALPALIALALLWLPR